MNNPDQYVLKTKATVEEVVVEKGFGPVYDQESQTFSILNEEWSTFQHKIVFVKHFQWQIMTKISNKQAPVQIGFDCM